MAFQPGDQLNNGKYTIERELGKGRFGVTYLAKSNGKDVAIKTLNEDLLNQLNQTERDNLESKFADEARKLERCKHPRIVTVYEIFKERQIILYCNGIHTWDYSRKFDSESFARKRSIGLYSSNW